MFRPVNRHGKLYPARLSAAEANRIVQRACCDRGRSEALLGSLPAGAGLATAAAEAGVSERAIMTETGHRSLVVARGYIRSGSLFRDNAAAQVGL